ncbi:hypothetical protein BDC45DRAFT_539150 [Circinella umbellata]|nr:hypothetical protein BDC45DRAFT_539150 [Circinella umbellata]
MTAEFSMSGYLAHQTAQPFNSQCFCSNVTNIQPVKFDRWIIKSTCSKIRKRCSNKKTRTITMDDLKATFGAKGGGARDEPKELAKNFQSHDDINDRQRCINKPTSQALVVTIIGIPPQKIEKMKVPHINNRGCCINKPTSQALVVTIIGIPPQKIEKMKVRTYTCWLSSRYCLNSPYQQPWMLYQ